MKMKKSDFESQKKRSCTLCKNFIIIKCKMAHAVSGEQVEGYDYSCILGIMLPTLDSHENKLIVECNRFEINPKFIANEEGDKND